MTFVDHLREFPGTALDKLHFDQDQFYGENSFSNRYFQRKKFERQKNNFIHKFYFCQNFFSYRFEPNF